MQITILVNNAVDYYKGGIGEYSAPERASRPDELNTVTSISSRLPAEALPLIEGNEAMLEKALNIIG